MFSGRNVESEVENVKRDKKFYVYLSLVIIETLGILWFSFIPTMDFVDTGVMRLGDLEHLIAYAVYGFLLQRFFVYFFSKRKSLILSVMVGSFVGGSSEIIQYMLPYRIGDVIDWIIDSIGCSLGSLTSSKFKPYSQIN